MQVTMRMAPTAIWRGESRREGLLPSCSTHHQGSRHTLVYWVLLPVCMLFNRNAGHFAPSGVAHDGII